MTITKVWIDEDCVACGMSELICPEVFKVDYQSETSTVVNGADLILYEVKIREAAMQCPLGTIRFTETDDTNPGSKT